MDSTAKTEDAELKARIEQARIVRDFYSDRYYDAVGILMVVQLARIVGFAGRSNLKRGITA